jgi:hypothetical protein
MNLFITFTLAATALLLCGTAAQAAPVSGPDTWETKKRNLVPYFVSLGLLAGCAGTARDPAAQAVRNYETHHRECRSVAGVKQKVDAGGTSFFYGNGLGGSVSSQVEITVLVHKDAYARCMKAAGFADLAIELQLDRTSGISHPITISPPSTR